MSYPHGSIIVHSAATTIQLKQGPSGKNTWTFFSKEGAVSWQWRLCGVDDA